MIVHCCDEGEPHPGITIGAGAAKDGAPTCDQQLAMSVARVHGERLPDLAFGPAKAVAHLRGEKIGVVAQRSEYRIRTVLKVGLGRKLSIRPSNQFFHSPTCSEPPFDDVLRDELSTGRPSADDLLEDAHLWGIPPVGTHVLVEQADLDGDVLARVIG